MADTKISQLIQTINLTGEELVPVSIDGQNKVVKTKYLKGADNLTNEYVEVTGDDGKSYRILVKNQKAIAVPSEVYTSTPAKDGENVLFDGLVINQIYGGGLEIVETPVSHSFIELYNYREEEVNLNGLYLWYRAKAGNWQSLKLQGIVPPKHSFLVRCGQHNDPHAVCVRCPIVEYDMEWNIKLSNQGFSVYLCIGSETPEDNPVRQTVDALGSVTWTNGRYIDLLGAGGKQSDQTIWAYETRYLKCMDKNTAVHRVDFANSGKKNIGSNALVKGNNEADCEPIDYSTCNVSYYRPRSLADGRWTEFYDKPKQKENAPSMVNMMYGENGNTTRTFTFQTPINNEGFVRYRVDGETKWNTVETTTEIIKNMDGDTTVHRAIVRDLDFNKYEYQVGYEGCWSDISTFEVKDHNQDTPIRILYTSDQQSWTEREYDVWGTCARFLNTKSGDFDFHLNGGDISQNASRRFEWNYYYNHAKELTRNMCHAITCGNNDLIDKKYSDAFNYYITAENPFANSVHAYDLGFAHFVCLNSNTDSTYVDGMGTIGGYKDTNAFLQAQADWLDEHLTEVNSRPVKPRWIIVYAHLAPFTVGRVPRLQRWVSVMEKHKVDLFLCGHNHAYSRSKALYTGYDYNQSPDYNDYFTKITGTTELKIVDEYQADGVTEVNREEDIANGTVYLLNHACGFKLSGKERPITLPSNLLGTKHDNGGGSPWWINYQALPSNPVYIDLEIGYDSIKANSYEITGVVGYDEYKNTLINKDLSKVSETLFDTLTINYSDRNK